MHIWRFKALTAVAISQMFVFLSNFKGYSILGPCAGSELALDLSDQMTLTHFRVLLVFGEMYILGQLTFSSKDRCLLLTPLAPRPKWVI